MKKRLPVVLAVSSIAFLAACQRGVPPEREGESSERMPPAEAAPPPSLPPATVVPPPAQAERREAEIVSPALTSSPAPVPRVLVAGTAMPLVLQTTVASNVSQVGDPVVASLAEDAAVEGRVILAAGTEVAGRVTLAKQSGRVEGRARLVVEFDEVRDGGSSYRIEATLVDVTAASSREMVLEAGTPLEVTLTEKVQID